MRISPIGFSAAAGMSGRLAESAAAEYQACRRRQGSHCGKPGGLRHKRIGIALTGLVREILIPETVEALIIGAGQIGGGGGGTIIVVVNRGGFAADDGGMSGGIEDGIQDDSAIAANILEEVGYNGRVAGDAFQIDQKIKFIVFALTRLPWSKRVLGVPPLNRLP